MITEDRIQHVPETTRQVKAERIIIGGVSWKRENLENLMYG
jgi:hypothetical protein